jgi:hypothetical protein
LIKVQQKGGGDPLAFEVTVEESGTSRHRVTVRSADVDRLAGGGSAEQLVKAAFRFLLDREPQSAILGRFDLSAISRYFPEFEAKLPQYLKRDG